MIIAMKKTKVILLRSVRDTNDVSFKTDTDNIKPVPALDYLGFAIDRILRFNKHMNKICQTLDELLEIKKKGMCMVILSVSFYGASTWHLLYRRNCVKRST